MRLDKVVAIRKLIEKPKYVYDLEVEGFHTFLANSIYVHNTDGFYAEPIFSSKCSIEWLIDNIHKIESSVNAEIKNYVLQEYGVDPKDYKIYLEIKNIFEWIYFMTKNRLKGKKVWDGNKRISDGEESCAFSRGIEKSDVFPLLNDVRTRIFNILAENADSQTSFESESDKYLSGIRKKLFDREFDEKLVIKIHANQDLASYKNITPHVKAARKLNEKALFRVGDAIPFVIVGKAEDGLDAEPVIDDMPKIRSAGYEYYWGRIERLMSEILGREYSAKDFRLLQYT